MNELNILKKAIKFEIIAIKNNDTSTNPYYANIITMKNGSVLWETVNKTIELYFAVNEEI